MAYNYRPKTEKDIKDLGLTTAKEKVVIELFNDMKASFGKTQDEFITIDTASTTLGNTKILKAFSGMVDLALYKKKYPGIGLKFGDGTKPSSNAPTTQQQELVTLKIFEELLSSRTKRYTTFEQLLPELCKIYENLPFEKSWYASFELQFKDIDKTTKLPNNTFDVYNRDGGFMDYITQLVNSKFNIAKKDSWNPADIWLIKSSQFKKYEKALDEAITIQEVNAILVEAYNKYDIVGVSLKKNNGKQLQYELVNLKSSSKVSTEVDLLKYDLNVEFNKGKQMFAAVTSKINIQYQGKKYGMQIKSNQAQIANVTYEFAASGSVAFLGKVPKDMLKLELSRLGYKMPEQKDFMEFNRDDMEKKLKVIKANRTIFSIKGDLNQFVDNLEESWSKGRAKDNVVMSQIITFAYIVADLPSTQRKEFVRDLFFMAQKKGPKFGPFGKLY